VESELGKEHVIAESLSTLRRLAEERGWTVEVRDINYGRQARVSDGENKATVAFYATGKALIQGRLSPLTKELDSWWASSHSNRSAYVPPPNAKTDGGAVGVPHHGWKACTRGVARIGIDESGKGDYFGPLVAAGVYVDVQTETKLADSGVQDSKRLSDKRILALAELIVAFCPHSVVTIGPSRYNELYKRIGNVNRMLAWAHARCLENLLQTVCCELAVSDQFGDESYLDNALMRRGRQITLEQRPRAEEDVAVAAASILARAEFVRRLQVLSKRAGVELPKGASDPRILEVGSDIVASEGREALAEYAKIHFRTTEALGL
jgi:ribonuclease HIII